MADKKITALTALGATDVAPAADLLHIIDYSASPVNKNITVANLFSNVNTDTHIYGVSKTFEIGSTTSASSAIKVTTGSNETLTAAAGRTNEVIVNDNGVGYINFTVKSLGSDQAIKVDAQENDILINGDSNADTDLTVKGGTATTIYSDGGLDCVGIGTGTVDGTGTLTVAADATTGHGILNAGNLVLSGAPGTALVGGASGSPTVIPVTTAISYLSVDGTKYFSLANGTQGQIKILACTVGTNTPIAKTVPATYLGANTHLSLQLGEAAVLVSLASDGWVCMGSLGGAIGTS